MLCYAMLCYCYDYFHCMVFMDGWSASIDIDGLIYFLFFPFFFWDSDLVSLVHVTASTASMASSMLVRYDEVWYIPYHIRTHT